MRKSTPRAARNPVDRRDQGDRQGGARSRFLVLWDIDGTLVQAGDVGRDIFTEAFQAVLGRAPDQVAARMLAMAGRTDPEIALEFLAAHEIAEADGERHLPAFSEALATALAAKAALIR
ncbi:MAG TPA: hypothetical protein VIJ05_07700, partial [Actinomycetes bacterium]